MHSKFQELRDKAKFWFAQNYNLSVQEIENSVDPRIKQLIEEKFLELLVLECAEVVHDKNKVALMQRARIYVFPEDIANHFGFIYDKNPKH